MCVCVHSLCFAYLPVVAVLEEKMNVWGILKGNRFLIRKMIVKHALGANSSLLTELSHTLVCIQSCSHCFRVLVPRAAIQILVLATRIQCCRQRCCLQTFHCVMCMRVSCTLLFPRVHDFLGQRSELLRKTGWALGLRFRCISPGLYK